MMNQTSFFQPNSHFANGVMHAKGTPPIVEQPSTTVPVERKDLEDWAHRLVNISDETSDLDVLDLRDDILHVLLHSA